MITDGIEQRSISWFRSRVGFLTGSKIADIMKSGRKKDEIFSEDVNVRNLREFDIENDLYHDTLWENMFDYGEYAYDGCNEAVGFIQSNACHAEVYGNAMYVRWIKDCADKLRLAMVANDMVNNLMGTEKEKFITDDDNGITLLTYADIYLNIFVNFEKRHIQILAYQKA